MSATIRPMPSADPAAAWHHLPYRGQAYPVGERALTEWHERWRAHARERLGLPVAGFGGSTQEEDDAALDAAQAWHLASIYGGAR